MHKVATVMQRNYGSVHVMFSAVHRARNLLIGEYRSFSDFGDNVVSK